MVEISSTVKSEVRWRSSIYKDENPGAPWMMKDEKLFLKC